jgi:hypothetical protein
MRVIRRELLVDVGRTPGSLIGQSKNAAAVPADAIAASVKNVHPMPRVDPSIPPADR